MSQLLSSSPTIAGRPQTQRTARRQTTRVCCGSVSTTRSAHHLPGTPPRIVDTTSSATVLPPVCSERTFVTAGWRL
ncbi:hypothetical protein Y032_0243g3475 [Ancylostoma ceylanicum]|uniref:Uncharacterized protein n=1 Tax=Ancylostoma ceylanicum TaxID=53326 RepID=A0A016SE33_9BILA|nr:hypothetical protein Y032_0243g3475 [Ancylostoma ceylanicum]